MGKLVIFAILLGLTVALPQKVLDPKKDIKFDHHEEEKHLEKAADDDHHDDVDHDLHNHLEADHHHGVDHHGVDHHLAAHEHKLLHRAHVLADREHAVAHREHVLAQHEHALATHLLVPPHPVLPLGKHTSFLLVPLPPPKPGALHDTHAKKHALFVPAVHH